MKEFLIKGAKPIGLLDDLRRRSDPVEEAEEQPQTVYNTPIRHHHPLRKRTGKIWKTQNGSPICRVCSNNQECGLMPRQSCALFSREKDCI